MEKYQIVVIRAGAAGLVVALGAAQAGKKVLLIEKGTYGGDCTHFGCIPSKSLIASGKIGHALKMAKYFGLLFAPNDFSAKWALQRVRRIIEHVRSHEDVSALAQRGVTTLTGFAEFKNSHLLLVKKQNGTNIEIFAGKVVIATGSSPSIPVIDGLSNTPYLTNETIFELEEIPQRLAILGAGPMGCEMAQAFLRLNSQVYLIESKRGILPNDETQVQEVLESQFDSEGMQIFQSCEEHPIGHQNGIFEICVIEKKTRKHLKLQADQLLIATGRKPNIKDLKLENAGIEFSGKGIIVDRYARTKRKHIFAIGDVIGAPFFTHHAEHQARALLRNLLLPFLFKKLVIDKQSVPHVTFTDPEVASFGLKEREALETYGDKRIAVYHVPLAEIDRAVTEDTTNGFVKIITKKWSSQILGATIVAPRAGEMLMELSLAKQTKTPLRKLADLIHPYPIYSAAIRKAADLWLTQTLLSIVKAKKQS